MLELLFLLGFTLHNLEEAVWLPGWSKYAKRFHPEVKKNEFHFAVVVISVIGYLLTFYHLTNKSIYAQYAFYGFVLMMCFNVVFPHLIAAVILRRYAPGLLTGLFLNVPFGTALIQNGLSDGISQTYLVITAVMFGIVFILLARPLFKIGGCIIDPY
jgi:hypothetical protein